MNWDVCKQALSVENDYNKITNKRNHKYYLYPTQKNFKKFKSPKIYHLFKYRTNLAWRGTFKSTNTSNVPGQNSKHHEIWLEGKNSGYWKNFDMLSCIKARGINERVYPSRPKNYLMQRNFIFHYSLFFAKQIPTPAVHTIQWKNVWRDFHFGKKRNKRRACANFLRFSAFKICLKHGLKIYPMFALTALITLSHPFSQNWCGRYWKQFYGISYSMKMREKVLFCKPE